MKQTRLWLTTIATLLCSLAASAHDFETGGIYYNITSSTDLTVAVTYRGNYYNSYSNEYSGAVTVPETVTYNNNTYSVTSIGNYAFEDCSSLTSITIPEGVTSIGGGAFERCYSLTSITIPEGVTSIGDYAFTYCSLTSITIPEGVTSIGNYAFWGCRSLTAITLSEGVTSIGAGAFRDCYNLTAITLPEGVTSIGYNAFYNCSSLTAITLSEGVTSIGDSAFYGTAWYDNQPDGVIYAGKVLYKYKGTMPANTSVEVKEGTVSIGSSAFDGCSGLTAITLPASVTSIGYYAFRYCSSLTSITIPEGVTSIGNSAFYGTAWYDNQPDGVIYIGKVLYKYKGTMPENTSIEVKEGIVSISPQAFEGCSSLTAITIPEGVTSIGSYAFRGCSSLTSITLPEGVTSIGNSAFYNCSSLTSITLPETVTSIEHSAFSGCSSLTSITLPEGVTSIGNSAFYNCSSLTSITLPETVTSIEHSAFSGCSSLTAINIPEGVTSIRNYAFEDCSSLTTITIPEGVTSIGEEAFYGCENLKMVINYSDLTLQKGVSGNGYAGYYADRVFNVDEVIEDYAFKTKYGVHNLIGYIGDDTELTLPTDYQGDNYHIEDAAFYNCSSLTSIIIPEGVTSIGEEAFYGCENLKMVINYSDLTLQKGDSGNGYVAYYAEEVINNAVKVGDYGFATIDNVHYLLGYTGNETELILPDDYQGENYQIRKDAFRGCSSLTSIIIPEGVTSIGEEAFYGCENLKMVINYSDLTLQKGDSGNGYAGYYADRVFNVDEVIEDYAFKTKYGVHNLIGYIGDDTELTLPTDYQGDNYHIEDAAFYNCSSLTSIIIPEGVTSIGEEAFYGCENLKMVINYSDLTLQKGDSGNGYAGYYADRVFNVDEVIEDYAFKTKYGVHNLIGYIGDDTELTLPTDYQGDNYHIEDAAFYNCSSLTSITIPEGVTSIGELAFYGCKSLTAITIPENSQLTSIGEGAFYNCSSLTAITIPEGVTSIGNSAFYGTAWYDNQPDGVIYIGKVLYKYKGTMPENTSIEVKEGIVSISPQAFEGCSSLTAITIPEGVTSIGSQAFDNCSSLTAVHISSIEAWCYIDFEGSDANPLYYAKNLYINGELVTELVIPNSVTAVKDYAFRSCTSLTIITIPEGVTSIGDYAFYGCKNLKTVINYSDLTLQKGDSGNSYVAYYADKVVNVDCIVDGYCFKTRDGVHCLIDYLGDDTALVLPEDYQGDDYVIAESVFQGNVDIVSVKIPQTIGTIGNSAFADCANLASVEMARGVMSIGDKAFENCTSLASVAIPQNMRSIGHGAFKGCSSLASVEFKEGVETFGDNAFEGCAALTEITLPKSLTAVGANAFKGCSGLTSVIVDKNVETFGTGAFEGCTVVKTLVVKGSVMPTVPSSALTLIVLYSPHPLAAEEFANKVYRDATLYVPTGSIARYQAADVWKNFWTIKEFDSTQEMSLSLDQATATLTEDESLTLTAAITPEFMADMTVTWSTSDAAVATVDEHGVVTALAAGTATITATTGGMQATCVVTVTKKEGEDVGIENSEIRNHESEIFYDLSGRRVEKMEKGIYIVGGKKVVIK